MTELNRRNLLVGGAAGAVATATGIAIATSVGGNGSGAPTLPKDDDTYKFRLADADPTVHTEGGSVTECNEENFPVLAGNAAALFELILKPGALREPHWHPNAWELDYCVSGKGRLGIVTPDGTYAITELEPGDVGFIPQGWAHFIENAGDKDMKFVIAFNNSQPNNIGLSTTFGGMPTSTFTETLELPSDGLADADKADKTLFIVP